MDDIRIVALYWERSEEALERSETNYGNYLRFLATRILTDPEDAKEIVNDVYRKAWDTIPPNRPASLKTYLGRICKQLAVNRYNANRAQKRNIALTQVLDELTECLPAAEQPLVCESIALKDTLNRFLASLPERTRNIFVQRYWYTCSIAEIAREFGMKESAVTMLLLRTREKLKNTLQQEGFEL